MNIHMYTYIYIHYIYIYMYCICRCVYIYIYMYVCRFCWGVLLHRESLGCPAEAQHLKVIKLRFRPHAKPTSPRGGSPNRQLRTPLDEPPVSLLAPSWLPPGSLLAPSCLPPVSVKISMGKIMRIHDTSINKPFVLTPSGSL